MEKSVKRSNNKQEKDELVVVEKIFNVLKDDKDVQQADWTNREIEYIRQYNLFTAKPLVFLVNVSLDDWLQGKNKWIIDIQKWVDEHYPCSPVIPFSAVFEKQLIDNFENEQQREEYLKEHKTKSAIHKIIKAGYDALSLIHFFTAGEDEVKCWTIREGTKAPQAGGVIHSDFETGFICAEIMAYKDFKKYGGEHECKANGKYRQQGKEHPIEDGDIILFKFNRPAPKKK